MLAFIITTAGCGTMQAVNIALAADPGCVLGCAVTLQSIIDNANQAADLHFYLFLTGNVKPVDRRRLVQTVEGAGRNAHVHLGEFDPRNISHLTRSKLITHTAYASCCLEELLPAHATRSLYVDCDLVVERDVCELWDTDLEGKTAGAVMNGSDEDSAQHQKRLQLSAPRYFNSGVVLIDMVRWRQLGVGPRALKAAEKFGPQLILHDQDALNHALDGDWVPLPAYWNVWVIMPGLEREHQAVFHYMGAPKPWHADYDRPFPEHFFRYLDRTPYKGWRPWNPGGVGAKLTRWRRAIPSVPGVLRALRALRAPTA